MQPQSQTFINTSLIGSSVTQNLTWVGGRTTLTVAATQFGTGVQPQLQALNNIWVPICSAIVSGQIFTFDAPPGQYRIAGAGSSVSLAATMSLVPT